MKRLLIFGAYGLLGSYLRYYLKSENIKILSQGRGRESELSINPINYFEIENVLLKIKPDFVINLIAQTNVDQCEINQLDATGANTDIVKNISIAVKKTGCRLIHISTDHLYSGLGPHHEKNINIINFYAKSKYLGELEAKKCNAIILRTNFVGKSMVKTRISFTDWLIKEMDEKGEVRVFKDVLFSPIHMQFLGQAIQTVIQSPVPGTYNIGSNGGVSKAEFAFELAKYLGKDCSCLKYTSIDDLKLKAKRPSDMRMKVEKFEMTFKFKLPSIDDTILQCARDYKNEQ